MALTNAQTVTDMADTTSNPTRSVVGGDTAELQITLRYDSSLGTVTLDPNNIFLAIRGASSVGATKIFNQHGNSGTGQKTNNGYNYTFVVTA